MVKCKICSYIIGGKTHKIKSHHLKHDKTHKSQNATEIKKNKG